MNISNQNLIAVCMAVACALILIGNWAYSSYLKELNNIMIQGYRLGSEDRYQKDMGDFMRYNAEVEKYIKANCKEAKP
jgi:hypothetical protein